MQRAFYGTAEGRLYSQGLISRVYLYTPLD